MRSAHHNDAIRNRVRQEDLARTFPKNSQVTAAELSAWRDAFLAAGEASLKTRPAGQ